MFGFEIQTSGNVFLSGVGEREVAYLSDDKLLTLEGDETRFPGATAELEFVTAPCKNPKDALGAVEHAAKLAGYLVEKGGVAGIVKVARGDRLLGGTWAKDCSIFIDNRACSAQYQATVGVPLGGLGTFVDTVLQRSASHDWLEEHVGNALRFGMAAADLKQVSDPLRGFLKYCYLFLFCTPELSTFAYSNRNAPGIGTCAAFDLSAQDYIKGLQGDFPGGLVLVNIDSPKSMYNVLPRTDFHSMFMALPASDQQIVRTAGDKLIFPPEYRHAAPDVTFLVPSPYRGEHEATDAAVRAPGLVVEAQEYREPGTETNVPAANWRLMLHGPSIAEWWQTVLDGDPKRRYAGVDGQLRNLPKDAMSPPAGFRGRAPQLLGTFPTAEENKKDYYGMGAFPMDNADGTPLAVVEYRAFMSDVEVRKLAPVDGPPPVTREHWGDAAKIFIDHYLPR